jgi:hypothetical protein
MNFESFCFVLISFLENASGLYRFNPDYVYQNGYEAPLPFNGQGKNKIEVASN